MPRPFLLVPVLTAALLAGLCGNAHAAPGSEPGAPLQDGGFESASLPDGGGELSFQAGDGLGAWRVTDGEVALVRGTAQLPAAEGEQFVVLGESGGIEQTVATTPGQSYELSFAATARPDSSRTRRLEIAVNTSATGQDGVFQTRTVLAPQADGGDPGWRGGRVVFTAANEDTRIGFQDTTRDAPGPGVHLDDVRLVPRSG
ncbi:DUF642 domain-containing protein [Nocardiopsis flavescens]|uniref:DUF642 domain-containing protein n=1 Tax=Nocardiopsis flavescens TaxID=758803 RepID=UPI0036638E86